MKNIFKVITLLLLQSLYTNAQNCEITSPSAPQLGAMIEPQFSNLWKQATGADEHGINFKKDNTPSIGDDGWTVDGVNHNFRFSLGTIQPRLKNGDIIKVKFRGTMAQVGPGIESCIIQNIQSDNIYTAFEVKITDEASSDGFIFQLKNRCTDIQMMRPGYSLDDNRLLTDDYIRHVAHWSTFRYANLLSANSNFGQTWAKRVSSNAPVYINQGEWSSPSCNDPNPKYSRFSEDITPVLADDMQSSYSQGNWSPGAPWETLIDISNYANKDMWINIPVMADDNYVLQLSKLIKQRLKPSLNVNVEIGTELWNYGMPFLGFRMVRQVLADEWLERNPEKLKILGGTYCAGCQLDAPETGLVRTSCNYNDYQAMQHWMARRLKEMMEQFAIDWGWKTDGGVGSRIRATLAGQVGYANEGHAWNIGPGLEFLTKAYGTEAPSKYLYSVSVAPYFIPSEPGDIFTPDLSVDRLVENYSLSPRRELFDEYSLEKYSNWYLGNQLEGVFAIAKMCGIKMFAYEGGNELVNFTNSGTWGKAYNNASAVMKDPRFGNANTALLNEWFGRYGGDALFIKNGDFLSDTSAYAISSTLNEANALRQSYINVATSPPLPMINTTRGKLGVVTVLDARKHASYPEYWDVGLYGLRMKHYASIVNSDYSFRSNDNWTAPMLIYCERPGIYKLELERAQMGDKSMDGKYPTYCDVFVDERLVRSGVKMGLVTFSRQLTDATNRPNMWWTEAVEIEIPHGMHAIRVRPSMPTASRPGNVVAIFNEDMSRRFTNHLDLMSYRFTLQTDCDPLLSLSAKAPPATESIVLFPNPTEDGKASVQFATDVTTHDAYLLSAQGQKLRSFSNISNGSQIDLSDVANGVYYLVFNTSNGSLVKRVVKIK